MSGRTAREQRNDLHPVQKRGDPLLRLFEHFGVAAKTRARKIAHFNIGQADQLPALWDAQAYGRWTRWNSPKFGKAFAALCGADGSGCQIRSCRCASGGSWPQTSASVGSL